MRETKLKRLILGIGIGTFVLLVAIVLIWKLKFYDTVNAEIAKQQTAYDAEKATAEKLKDSKFAKKLAEQKKQFAQAQLDYLRLRYRSLSFDLSTPGATEATFGRYLNEYFGTRGIGFGPALRRQLLSAARQAGVTLSTKAAVATPPQEPEQVAVPPSGFIKPLTTDGIAVQITGDLEEIQRFLNIVNNSEILMTVGNIALQKGSGTAGGATPGAAPASADVGDTITASFTITPYLLATGPSAVVGTPALPAAAGAAPAGAAPAIGPDGAPLPTDPALAGGAPPGGPGAPPTP